MTDVTKVHCPGNISCFFRAYPEGSTGCGINTDKGVETIISKGEGIFINSKLEKESTSGIVLKNWGVEGVRVEHNSEVPIGYGFGTSASGALGLSYSINSLLNNAKEKKECIRIAHESEIVAKTGLGDVIGIANNDGVGLKIAPGLDGLKKENRIAIDCPKYVVCGLFEGILETKKILTNSEIMENVNRSGEKCAKSLADNPTYENLIYLSREFTKESGLWNDKIKNAMREIPESSMIMLGNGIYALTDNPSTLTERISKFTNEIIVCSIVSN